MNPCSTGSYIAEKRVHYSEMAENDALNHLLGGKVTIGGVFDLAVEQPQLFCTLTIKTENGFKTLIVVSE